MTAPNWIETEATENLICRRVSPDGRVEMGVYPVLYGMRVRAGYVGSLACAIDWCAGDRQDSLETLYGICRRIVGARLSEGSPFDGIPPRSEVKPWTNDRRFMARLATLNRIAGDETAPFPLPPIAELRRRYFAMHGPLAHGKESPS